MTNGPGGGNFVTFARFRFVLPNAKRPASLPAGPFLIVVESNITG